MTPHGVGAYVICTNNVSIEIAIMITRQERRVLDV